MVTKGVKVAVSADWSDPGKLIITSGPDENHGIVLFGFERVLLGLKEAHPKADHNYITQD